MPAPDSTSDLLVGSEGNGWLQVTSELVYERSGPDRWMSSFHVFRQLVDRMAGSRSDLAAYALGRLAVHLWTLQKMSMSVAGKRRWSRMWARSSSNWCLPWPACWCRRRNEAPVCAYFRRQDYLNGGTTFALVEELKRSFAGEATLQPVVATAL